MFEVEETINNLQNNDKVRVVYGDKQDCLEGYISEVTKNHITIHEYVPDTYKTLTIDSILEIQKTRGKINGI